jgi:hypothetical protein
VENAKWLDVQYRYATIWTSISSKLSPRPTRPSRDLSNLELELRNWYDLIPETGRLCSGFMASTIRSRQVAICVLFQHLEARLYLLDVPHDMATSLVNLLSIAKRVFEASSKIEDGFYDRWD